MTATTEPLETAASRAGPPRFRSLLSRFGIFLILLILVLIGGALSKSFLSASNISNLLLQIAPLGIVAIGQTFVMVVRGLDLSVASMMATAAVIATGFSGSNDDVALIVAAVAGTSICVGLINGFLVAKRGVSPFLATLATMILLQGFRFAYTQGAPSGNVPPLFRALGSGKLYGIPYNCVILLAVVTFFGIVLHRSAFGRRVFIVGGNPITGHLLGIRTDVVTIACYLISSCLAGTAGLILSGYVGLVDNWVGQGYELDSIVACVIGGVSLKGGRGSIAGALAGAATIMVAANEVLLFGLPIQVQIIIKGVVIVFAAALYAG